MYSALDSIPICLARVEMNRLHSGESLTVSSSVSLSAMSVWNWMVAEIVGKVLHGYNARVRRNTRVDIAKRRIGHLDVFGNLLVLAESLVEFGQHKVE